MEIIVNWFNKHGRHRKRRMSYEDTLTTLLQSLSALEYLHGRETLIMHRDIKLENILVLTRDPLYIKLGDFGLTKVGGSLKTSCGTGTYFPPEIAKYFGLSRSEPKVKYTEAVDIWSLGVVILRGSRLIPTPASYTKKYEPTPVGYHAKELWAETQSISSGNNISSQTPRLLILARQLPRKRERDQPAIDILIITYPKTLQAPFKEGWFQESSAARAIRASVRLVQWGLAAEFEMCWIHYRCTGPGGPIRLE
ncbi:kinase-like protein [Zopfia rhizophila CBS 207.26]|uniref:Kinase-like protein n=1 Tax=Zopfia rhizophila CBS 207.26 TaxID=1314779 RepID=A0A6A6DEV7_9PEZI|nr:kinase-like protein [Zopfia rhizophila CBS 207.26]